MAGTGWGLFRLWEWWDKGPFHSCCLLYICPEWSDCIACEHRWDLMLQHNRQRYLCHCIWSLKDLTKKRSQGQKKVQQVRGCVLNRGVINTITWGLQIWTMCPQTTFKCGLDNQSWGLSVRDRLRTSRPAFSSVLKWSDYPKRKSLSSRSESGPGSETTDRKDGFTNKWYHACRLFI